MNVRMPLMFLTRHKQAPTPTWPPFVLVGVFVRTCMCSFSRGATLASFSIPVQFRSTVARHQTDTLFPCMAQLSTSTRINHHTRKRINNMVQAGEQRRCEEQRDDSQKTNRSKRENKSVDMHILISLHCVNDHEAAFVFGAVFL